MKDSKDGLIQCGEKGYTWTQLKRIGHSVASTWGGECVSWELQSDGIQFNCIEHGEFFATKLLFHELEEHNHY